MILKFVNDKLKVTVSGGNAEGEAKVDSRVGFGVESQHGFGTVLHVGRSLRREPDMRFGRVAFEAGAGEEKIERVVDAGDAFVTHPCKE